MQWTAAAPGRIGRRLVMSLAMVLAAMAVAVSSAAAETVGWDAFAAPDGSGGALNDRDTITLETQANAPGVPAGHIEVRLATIDGMTWRKGIEIDKRARVCGIFTCWTADKFISGMYLQDHDHGPAARLVAIGDLRNPLGYGRLRFGKAKAFGYFVNNAHEVRFDADHLVSGTRYTFTWVTD